MEQTVVEWLFDNLNECFDKFDNGEYSYGDFLNASKEVKEEANKMFEQQLESCWNSSDQNMRSTFSSSAYKEITFKQWLDKFKQEK